MAPDVPLRRFAPEPVEQTTKTSRKFAPQPVEVTSKSSRNFAPQPVGTASTSSRRFPPEPAETTSKSSRKFAPEPVETASKSPRKFAPEPVETTSKSSRKFAPQPVETSSMSSRSKKEAEAASNTRGKFSPQPVETPVQSTRNTGLEGQEDAKAIRTTEKPVRRIFAPDLIETSKRTRKTGDSIPALLPSDKTEVTPGAAIPQRLRPLPMPITVVPTNTPVGSTAHVPQSQELRRDRSPFSFARPDSRSSNRRHSFRVPDLDPIESSGSEESAPQSLSTTPSEEETPFTTNSDISYDLYKHATRIRESVDDRFSGYLLQLAARAAEKQLREQALAAFPNSDFHERVAHYVDSEDDAMSEVVEDRPATWDGHDEDDDADIDMGRRDSSASISWEVREMQKHQEALDRERQNRREPTAQVASPGPWWNPISTTADRGRDTELRSMRDSARPPMLGADLRFPRCPSPEPARFDVTQGSTALRQQMCYLTEITQTNEEQGLWAGAGKQTQKTTGGRTIKTTLKSNASTRSQGLWGGFCFDTGSGSLAAPTGPTGLMTPALESGNPFESPHHSSTTTASPLLHQLHQLPPSPPRSANGSEPTLIDTLLHKVHDQKDRQAKLETEFPDSFVTQVYNYLSLGYPALARPFDAELAKISGIPVCELRADDALARSRGYIRFGEDMEITAADGREVTEEGCKRWQALWLYVREWARQGLADEETAPIRGNWGTGARRGSWAL
ncbi:hypothetical protein B0A49_02281 [Cryomyces minteri]|uniref:Uncharacterized protein n=1 Tax=Cryomyces minteri TaxID=331657 RepID=A0A4U0XPL1_9PEZI|nr:hypothetical protein B0A49_02281 [Cryomyces minteri]